MTEWQQYTTYERLQKKLLFYLITHLKYSAYKTSYKRHAICYRDIKVSIIRRMQLTVVNAGCHRQYRSDDGKLCATEIGFMEFNKTGASNVFPFHIPVISYLAPSQ